MADIIELLDSQIEVFEPSAVIEDWYRFVLTRPLSDPMPAIPRIVVWIMLNPSTATATDNDPTINRIVKFSKRWGFDVAIVVNQYPIRSSQPSAIKEFKTDKQYDYKAAMRQNGQWIGRAMNISDMVVAAWGNDGDFKVGRALWEVAKVKEVPFKCLGATGSGAPKHPLARGIHRIPDDFDPIDYMPPEMRPEEALIAGQVRYFHHPESDSVWTSTENEADGEVVEIDQAQYESLKAQYELDEIL